MAAVATLPETFTNRLDLERGFWQRQTMECAPVPEARVLELTEIVTVRALLPFKASEETAM